MSLRNPNMRGFTFIEMLLVLTIVMVVTASVMSISYRHFERNGYEQAVEQFRMTLHYAQTYAMENNQRITVSIVDRNTLIMYYEFEKRIIEWDFPEGMTAQIYTNDRKIHFTINGTIVQPGSVELITPKKTWKYSINFSKGRLRLIE